VSAPIDYAQLGRRLKMASRGRDELHLREDLLAAAKLCEAWPLVEALLRIMEAYDNEITVTFDHVRTAAKRLREALKP
jgi:hypothetical protein